MFWDVLSTFIDVLGNFKTSSAQQKAASYNANLSRYNANVDEQQGVLAQQQTQLAANQRLGIMRANIGASGLDLEGSGLDLLYSSSYQANIDANTAKWNYDVKAKGQRMQADLYDQQGSDAQDAGYINAASSLLKGATSYYKNNASTGAGTTPFSLGG